MLLHIQVIPGAKHEKREEQTDLLGNISYKIRLTVPPIDGKANEALLKFLSNHFSIAKTRISLVRGHSSRHKIVEIPL